MIDFPMKKIFLFLALAAAAIAQPVTQIGTGNVSGTLYFGGATTGGNISGASGALNLNSLGTNQNVTVAPIGTGSLQVLQNTQAPGGFARGNGIQLTGITGTTAALQIDGVGAGAFITLRQANGTAASPSALTNGNAYGTIGARGYGATTYSTGERGFIGWNAAANWTDTNQPSYFTIGIVPIQAGNNATQAAMLTLGRVSLLEINQPSAAYASAAWGVNGISSRFNATTFTDSSSSGTVANAVANSYAQPTFSGSSAIVFTVSDNVNIANAPAAGTNVTNTQANALHVAAGATRLDGGLRGTATNDSAAAGFVGETISAIVATPGSSISTNTTLNVTSITLTAGDWDAAGSVNFAESGATATAFSAGVTSTTATIPSDGSEVNSGVVTTAITGINGIAVPMKRFSLSGTTTVFLVARTTFTLGTQTAYGAIVARRRR